MIRSRPASLQAMSARARRFALGAGVCLAASLAGCGGGNETELTQELANLTRDAKGRVAPLPQMAPYQPPAYEARDLADPFSEKRIAPANRIESGSSSAGASLAARQKSRPRQPLEAFPIESLKMVGTLTVKNQPNALIRLEQAIYRVKVGDYIGQNMGRITAISLDEVTLRELVQDATGVWAERETSMTLQDTEGSKR